MSRHFSIRPRTKNQAELIRALVENDIILLSGGPGTGKTYLSLAFACQKLLLDEIDKILISRAIITCGNSKGVGTLPGDVQEKTGPYFIQFVEYIKEFLGNSYQKNMSANKIEFQPVELLRSRNFERTFMILDEAQNCSREQLMCFVGRASKGCKIVLIGDPLQSDYGDNVFGPLCTKIADLNMNRVEHIKFSSKDCQRMDIAYRFCEVIMNT